MNFRYLIKRFSDERWNIGFIENPISEIIKGTPINIQWMKHTYKDRWFADPFILDVTETKIYLLVEEWYKPIKRGRISRLIIDKKSFCLENIDVVLELGTHLSFPAIFRENGNIYIYPENSEAGHLVLYKYNKDTNSCKKIAVICDDAVTDSIIFIDKGERKMFATAKPNPNGNMLYVYTWDENLNKFVKKEIIHFNENIARMAGNIIEYNNKLYRPSQECNVQYGHSITLQEMSYIEGYHFHEIRRILPTHPQLNVGTHTFNTYKGLIVTDALGFDRMWIRKGLKVLGILK